MARISLTLTFLFLICAHICASESEKTLLTALEETLENKISDYAFNLAKWLEGFNDKYLGKSELGRLLHYDQIKPKLTEETGRRRSVKKMGMGMLPLIFHVGATSTWMVLTTILAAKSVAIGIALLVFKIAVSSAKVASFFTSMKNKHSSHSHQDWSWAPPHYEHHGHERSFPGIEPHISLHSDVHSYSPEWTPNDNPHEYKTIPTIHEDGPYPEITYAGDAKKKSDKYR